MLLGSVVVCFEIQKYVKNNPSFKPNPYLDVTTFKELNVGSFVSLCDHVMKQKNGLNEVILKYELKISYFKSQLINKIMFFEF